MALLLPPVTGCVGRVNSTSCSLRARKVNTFATLLQPRSNGVKWVEATSSFFEQDKRPIMLFDGVCNLCNGGVKFVNDRNMTIRYEPLQSEAGKMLLRRSGRAPDDISSVVLVEKERSYIKSEAVLKIMEYIDLPFPQLAVLLKFVPLGVCNLCNGGVKFVRDNDRNMTIRYEPLQSEAGKMLLRRSGRAPDDISSVVLVEKERSYIKSEAVLKIMEYIDLPFPQLAVLLKFVPLFVRDFVYDNVANNRYTIFGRSESCEI